MQKLSELSQVELAYVFEQNTEFRQIMDDVYWKLMSKRIYKALDPFIQSKGMTEYETNFASSCYVVYGSDENFLSGLRESQRVSGELLKAAYMSTIAQAENYLKAGNDNMYAFYIDQLKEQVYASINRLSYNDSDHKPEDFIKVYGIEKIEKGAFIADMADPIIVVDGNPLTHERFIANKKTKMRLADMSEVDLITVLTHYVNRPFFEYIREDMKATNWAQTKEMLSELPNQTIKGEKGWHHFDLALDASDHEKFLTDVGTLNAYGHVLSDRVVNALELTRFYLEKENECQGIDDRKRECNHYHVCVEDTLEDLKTKVLQSLNDWTDISDAAVVDHYFECIVCNHEDAYVMDMKNPVVIYSKNQNVTGTVAA